jgi:protein gp37
MRQSWVTDIRDQCLVAGVNFFFKQWGGVNKKRAGRLLEGKTWDEVPAPVRPQINGRPDGIPAAPAP